ncbi:ABC transporter ATP-binding protein [Alteribacillus sp. YIM 98480]|uniref:ABC transporter ATP-binding protein n=1 Tax=Alteribacillus sp. YIM 98480 TaxID=2606599 RepID=UPI00131CA514|nr:ABC transporter ATP-binding protein [Alteribacillus sp. YIM 98480]
MLEVKSLSVHFSTADGDVKAVDNVSFSIKPGETLGIVGESGSGKSVTALSIMQLNASPPCNYPSGEILFKGKDLLKAKEKELQKIRGNDIAMIFQDPMTSLNPVFTVGSQIIESIRKHQNVSKKEAKRRAIEMLTDVGIAHPEKRMKEYPHQYSGGMRQRAMIAMALSCNPKLLIADEPTTALDVTIQAQLLELMQNLQEKYGMAIIMITHDLGVVARIADRILVMYGGTIVEKGKTLDIFYEPLMPYSWSLMQSIPNPQPGKREKLVPVPGQPPNLLHLPEGCRFQPRCPFAREECKKINPPLTEKTSGHSASCILTPEEIKDEISKFKRGRGVI